MRRLKIETTRARQIAFVGLLVFCAAQVAWWFLDEVHYTGQVRDEIVSLHDADIQAASRLSAAGIREEDILALYPDLTRTAKPGLLAIAPGAREKLDVARYHRLNRYAWEGMFFLAVLFAGISVLGQALRQDAILRKRQQNFVAAVSHEFKSPLASLKLATETLELRDPPLEGRKKLLRRILEDVDRLEMMVSNILDTARIEEGRVHLIPERIPLVAAVQGVLEEVRERARVASVTMAESIPADLEIEAAPVAVQTVLRNLLDNAIKATASAGGGTVQLSAARKGPFIQLEVKDSGIGFPPGDKERLFEKFYRPGDEIRRKGPGSGLGLYIVKRFVQLEKGEINAHSEGPGRGAVFSVSWPVARKQTS